MTTSVWSNQTTSQVCFGLASTWLIADHFNHHDFCHRISRVRSQSRSWQVDRRNKYVSDYLSLVYGLIADHLNHHYFCSPSHRIYRARLQRRSWQVHRRNICTTYVSDYLSTWFIADYHDFCSPSHKKICSTRSHRPSQARATVSR